MSVLKTLLRFSARSIYRGPIVFLVRILGIESRLKEFYRWLLFVTSDDTVTVSVAGATAAFHIPKQRFWVFDDFENYEEYPVLEALLADLKPDDVFYDIGANIGIYTCLAADIISSGHVVAFEPHPENASEIKRNLSINGFNAEVSTYALSDSQGTAELAVASQGVGEGTHSLASATTNDTIKVDTIAGDTLVERNELPAPTVIKIDVEGAELSVIEGLRETLKRDECRLIYCEVHLPANRPSIADHGGSPEELHTELRDLGFDIEKIHERENDYHLKGRKR